MPSKEVAYSGSIGYQYRLKLSASLVQQDVANNRSKISITLHMRRVQFSGNGAYNLFGQNTNIQWNGQTNSRSNFTYDFRNTNGPIYMFNNYQAWVGHNSNGTKTITVYGYHNGANSPYVTTASTQFNYTLPTINRYASFTSVSITNVTDTSFKSNISVSATCNLLQYSLNGGSWTTAYSGSFTSRSFTLSNLLSDSSYTIRFRVRRSDSGLYTASSTYNVNTSVQNKFFDLFEF